MAQQKLYTEEQVRQAWNAAYIDALALDEDDYKPNFYDDFIKTITPIELPSDEEIELKAVSEYPFDEDLHSELKGMIISGERGGFETGAKWTKEQIQGGSKEVNCQKMENEIKKSKEMYEFIHKVDGLCREYGYEIWPTDKRNVRNEDGSYPFFTIHGNDGEKVRLIYIDGDGCGE